MGVIELLAWFYVDILILGDDHILERFVTIWLNVWSWHPLGWVGTISPSAKDTLDSPQQHKYPLCHQSPFVTNIPGARKVKVCVQLLSIHLHWNIYLQISNSAGTGTEAPKQFGIKQQQKLFQDGRQPFLSQASHCIAGLRQKGDETWFEGQGLDLQLLGFQETLVLSKVWKCVCMNIGDLLSCCHCKLNQVVLVSTWMLQFQTVRCPRLLMCNH